MLTNRNRSSLWRGLAGAIAVVAVCWFVPAASDSATAPENFASPAQAVDSFVAAARRNDPAELLAIFGPAGRDLVSSGDAIADSAARARFVAHYTERSRIVLDSSARATLIVGDEEWPFPIPIVRANGVWHFDTAAGAEEILDRRIGRNELNAMEVCRDFVRAERDYTADRAAWKLTLEFTRKFVSSPGARDGLYWPAQPGEKPSPIGAQMAQARAEGYAGGETSEAPGPYHGYYYRILTAQGPSAPGGARNYIVEGHMTGGFALIAYPAKYGDSGIMSFIVNQDGIVFEKNLGPDTAAIAAAITTFNPDRSWKTR